jgi:hypothetical protein
MVKAQVQSGATVQEAMQPSRAERQLCESYAQKNFMKQTLDFHWKRTMPNHSGKLAQNHEEAHLRREGIESD